VKFKDIGWNGFLIPVPEEMHLVRHGGNADQGTFSLESEEYMIEFNWRPIPKKPKPLLSVVETLIDQAKKNAKKKKQKLSIKGKKETTVYGHNAVYLRMETVVKEHYYVWYCQESNRLVIFRFVCETLDEKSRNLIKHLLNTLRCHMKEKNVWSLMRVRFKAPKSFLLRDARIGIGRGHIELAERKLSAFTEKTREIHVSYFSMANLKFKDTYEDPGKWFEKNYLKDLKKTLKKRRIKFETSGEMEIRGHKAVIKRAITKSGLTTRSTNLHTNATWYCSEMNRMYSVTVTSGATRPFFLKRKIEEEEHKELFNDILASFQCH